MINLILDALLGWLIDFIQILVEGVFGGDLSNIFSSFTDPSALQTTIPFINVLSNAMKAIGWIFLAINAYSIIIKALLSQFGGDGSTENPIKSMIKVFVAGFFIANQGSVMNLVSVLFGRISALMPMEMVTINNLSWWFSTDPGKIFTRIILLVMVAFGVVGAALAYIERLFSFIIFLYTYPIAVAFSINKETSDTFRQWLQGIVSQMIMIVLSTGMMFIAITLLNKAMGDIWLKPGSPLDSPIGNLNIFLYVLALNAMSIVKNSEKILNMYNIRTMPNSDTAAGFAGAFQNAMRAGMFAVRSTMGAARGIGAVAGDYSSIGAASPMDGGSGGGHSDIVNPMGATGPIAPSDGPADNIARSATNKRISESQGQDYATRVSQPQTMGNVSKDSSTVDKLSLAMAQPPTNAQKMQEFHDRNMDHQGGRAKTSLGKMFQNGNDMANFDNFSKGADDAIKDINASRTKVNGWLEDQQNGEKAIEKSDGGDGVQPAFGSEGLKAEDVYKAYGMANDQSLKNFKPEGYAVPVFKNGKMSGMMIKGQQENARTGEISNKTMYVLGYLAERNPDSVYFKYRKGETGRRFRVSDHDKLVRQLMISRSMIFMAAADVAVFSTQKPSMYRLYGNLSNGADGAYSEETDAELYPDYLKSDQQECLDLVNEKGVFYTNSEAKQFVDLIGGMDDSKSGRFETIRGSRCYGVYLSNKTAFLLYQEVPRSDKLIGVRHPFEERMHEAINDTFGEVMHYRQKVPYKNSVTDLYTAIISDGDSLVYSLSTRAKHGRIHYSNEELTDPDKRSQKIEKLANFSRINKILGSDSAKYPRVFVTPASFTGIISMNYLCHHTVEEYFQESSLVIKSRPDLFDPAKKMYDPFIFGWEKNTEHRVVNAIFIPVYEINLLRQLDIGSADEIELDGLAIITAPQMADCISHAIRRHAHYYDMATLNRIYIDNDTGAPTSFSASDMKIITDLVTANRVCGYGEFWSEEQLAAVKQEPTLKNNLSLVISRYPISASNKKTLPRDVIQYNRSGIAMNGMDKYKKLRGEHSDEKKYRRPASARTEMQLSIRDKSKLKKAARILGISANELAVNASVVYADNIILASKGKGDIRKKKDPSVCPK